MKLLLNKLSKTTKFLSESVRYCTSISSRKLELKPPWNILFFGSDDFSLASLKNLFREYQKQSLITKLEIVTSNSQNAVRLYAKEKHLPIHNWPLTQTVSDFHVGLVVSFGYLIPEKIINVFPMGMLNVHASLLPRWRGAAPIIYALLNGDKETGITLMKVRPKKFDCGEILIQRSIPIPKDMQMPQLYKDLALLGADTLVKALGELPGILDKAIPQSDEGVTSAPRITGHIAKVSWKNVTAQEVYNLSRALTTLHNICTNFKGTVIKLHNIKEYKRSVDEESDIKPGRVEYSRKLRAILVQCKDGKWISCDKIGINKKVISASDFNNGYLKKENLESAMKFQ